jgi:hypothetical protein
MALRLCTAMAIELTEVPNALTATTSSQPAWQSTAVPRVRVMDLRRLQGVLVTFLRSQRRSRA